MDFLKFQKIHSLIENATAEPWQVSGSGEDLHLVQTNHLTRDVWTIPRTEHDIQFIAAARTLMPLLLEVAEAARYLTAIGMVGMDIQGYDMKMREALTKLAAFETRL